MLRPRMISHMAMKMLRLLKKRRDIVRGVGVALLLNSWEMQAYVVAVRKRAMALPTLRRAMMIWIVLYWLLLRLLLWKK